MKATNMKYTKVKLRSFAAMAGLFVTGTFALHAQAPTPTGGSGPRAVAVLLCQYSDKPNTYGYTAAGILGTWMSNTTTVNGATVDNSINGLVKDASLGQVTLQGTQAFGWYTLPNPLSSYATGPAAGNDCIAAAQTKGVDLTPFTYVAVYVNDVLNDALGESWTATLPGPASPTQWNALIVGVRGFTSAPLVLHEIGHILSNMGWHTDSFSDTLGGAAYLGDDPLNPPSFPIRVANVSPEWDASRRELMGFIPKASNPTFTGGTQTYNLSRLTQPIAGLATAIDVPLPGGTKYVISARTRAGYDSYTIYPDQNPSYWSTLNTEGVRIELFTSTTVDAHIEMSNPGGDPTSTDAVWLTGQSYMDTANGITITVVNFNPTGNPTAQVTVSSGLSGNYRLNPQNASGLCLDVYGAGNTPGSNVDTWSCSGGSNQSFNFVSQGNGIYAIEPSYNTGLCLDVYGGATSPGTSVDVWSCTGGSNQKWSVISDGGNIYELAPQNAPGLRLDVFGASTSAGAQIDVWTATSGSNQKWAFTK